MRKPRFRNANVGVRGVLGYEMQVNRRVSQAQGTDYPSDPRSGASPTDFSSPLICCTLCHNTTLEHYPLPDATTNVTRRSSLNNICPHNPPRAHGGPEDVEWGKQVISPISVLMVNIPLTPTESDENGF